MNAQPAPSCGPLVDRFGRVHTSLRISVTDRCNIRCFYCMPNEAIRFKPRSEILSFEEIERFVRVAVELGIVKLRLTGGEPLVRHDMAGLVRRLRAIPEINEIALTTNGILLAEQAAQLRSAGLDRLNISLDALSEETFRTIARRDGLDRVLAGIAAAQRARFDQIRLNAVSIRGLTEDEIVPLARFARERNLELRFIEFMPLDADERWQTGQVLTGDEVRSIIADRLAPLDPVVAADPSQPAVDFQYRDHPACVGFINSVSQPFCGSCNRLRLTAEGQLRNCLFATHEWDVRALLRGGSGDESTDAELIRLIRDCVLAKQAGHGTDTVDFLRPERAMYQIGG